jgi:hypothetical protein
MKVAFACEDPVNDQYIAGPVLKAALASLGKDRVQVTPVMNPRTKGFENLVAQACAILERYGSQANAVVFVIDVDCEDGRPGNRHKVVRMQNAVRNCEWAEKAVVVGAMQEVEVWALWGSRQDLPDDWPTVREHCDPKEAYFQPLQTKLDGATPDGGRKRLVSASLERGWDSLSAGCDELSALVDDLRPLVLAA